ncbi:hypothetical protein AVEN_194487-1 [Araneus ventricosus]|uniref:Uncharacterized protein n=1 Tax=Araneus ventricosus TaxID=182803 RepID=A0A4Y2A657_ARAVE|nr:hypothetical protein AVEN_194487-1 [Araneus ventricosus]
METAACPSFPIRKVPSLQHITVLYVAFFMNNFNGMRDRCAQKHSKSDMQYASPDLIYRDRILPVGMREWISDALERLNNSVLPEVLKDKVSSFFIPLYSEILKFLNMNKVLLWTTLDVKECIVISIDGTVNHKKSHQKIIKNPLLDKKIRFVSACSICAEEDISNIWKNMSETEMEFYRTPIVGYNDYTPPLVMLWRDFLLNGNVDWPSDPSFFLSILPFSDAAYFIINKLPIELRRERIHQCFGIAVIYNIEADFWMERLDDELKREFIQTKVHQILETYITWPRTIYLTDAANLSWQFLQPHEFLSILSQIHRKIKNESEYFDHTDTFFDLYQACPEEYIKQWDIKDDLNCLRNSVTEIIRGRKAGVDKYIRRWDMNDHLNRVHNFITRMIRNRQ